MKTPLILNFIGILLAFFFSYNAQLARQNIEKYYALARDRLSTQDLVSANQYLDVQRGVYKSLWLCQSFTTYSIFLTLCSSIYLLVILKKSNKE
jgi:hypothetical protein